MSTTTNGDAGNGKQNWTVAITPKDEYGNFFGTGRLDVLVVTGAFGTVINGNGVVMMPERRAEHV